MAEKKALYYDCFCGISGDMHLGALLDAGVDPEYLQTELEKLRLDEFTLKIDKTARSGIAGTKADVVVKDYHHHGDGHHGNSHHAHARGYRDIVGIIEASDLERSVKQLSIKIFTSLGEAEAAVHRSSIEDVHFHEVGAVDSIVDIVGAAVCLDFLQPDIIYSSPVQLGGGFVTCAHGKLPVPAPATVELLKNIPVKTGLVEEETTTPTGAAIIASVADFFTEKQAMNIHSVGYGFGTRELTVPNALRVFIGTVPADTAADGGRTAGRYETEENLIIETNIDDMNPEMYGPLLETLLALGAKDVFYTPIIMKKTRPAVTVSVLVREEHQDSIIEALFKETSTFGVRIHSVTKQMLFRQSRSVETPYGEIRVKEGFLDGIRLKGKPEYEDCRHAASEHGVSFAEVYNSVITRILTSKNTNGEK